MRLEARDISFKYGEGTRQILNHVTLTVEAGEKVGIMAPSGYGKTTLCKILAGYEKPDQGEVLLDGTPIHVFRGYSPVQMVWQHPELSVNLKRRLRTVTAEGDWSFEDPGERARIEVGLGIRDEWKERFPVEVSGGELQRFCIARALGRRTKLLIADEMTTMLDLITQGQIWDFVLKELKRRDMGMIAVSHSPELLEKVCDRVVHLRTMN
ncbi:MAG: ATP-binding cassette domain-containing protein [Clostridium sp.]|nr:ATP-binding cassette domain-containing protein [Clostridium sp.]